jgi:uncharacterized protein YdeI (YjbR/CyaY-like superfamily)
MAERIETKLVTILFSNSKEWEDWIQKNINTNGLWIKFSRNNSKIKSISYQEALDVALCYGWIDGKNKSLDEYYWIQKFGPRRSRSIWSQKNKSRAEELIQMGLLKKSGLDAIEIAKKNGQWERAYESQKNSEPPKEFIELLNINKKAKSFYETLDSKNRYAILFRIQTAKKIETREKRMKTFIEMLERKEKIYP